MNPLSTNKLPLADIAKNMPIPPELISRLVNLGKTIKAIKNFTYDDYVRTAMSYNVTAISKEEYDLNPRQAVGSLLRGGLDSILPEDKRDIITAEDIEAIINPTTEMSYAQAISVVVSAVLKAFGAPPEWTALIGPMLI